MSPRTQDAQDGDLSGEGSGCAPWLGHVTALIPAHTHQGQRKGSSWRKQTQTIPSTQEKPTGLQWLPTFSGWREAGSSPCNTVSVGTAPWLNWVPKQAVAQLWPSTFTPKTEPRQQSPRRDSSSPAACEAPGMDVQYSHPHSSGEQLTGKVNWGGTLNFL